MPRAARLTVPGLPHHVTQRGNRCQRTFFVANDFAFYRDLLAEWARAFGVEIWAYCLMPNHTHVVAVPETEDALTRTMAEVHRRYTRHINGRMGWSGHLWQSRFASFAMDERHLLNCVRYVELNPVRAGLCGTAADWRWSSARAHLAGRDDGLCRVAPMAARVVDWPAFLDAGLARDELDLLRAHEPGNRPLGDGAFIRALEALTGRRLHRGKPGPRPTPESRDSHRIKEG